MEAPTESSSEVSPREALLQKLGLDNCTCPEDIERAYEARLVAYQAQIDNAGSKPERISAKKTLKAFEALRGEAFAEAARLRVEGLLEECREGLEKKRVGAVSRKIATIRSLCSEHGLEDGALARAIDDIEGDLEDVRLILGMTTQATPPEEQDAAEAFAVVDTPDVPEADLPSDAEEAPPEDSAAVEAAAPEATHPPMELPAEAEAQPETQLESSDEPPPLSEVVTPESDATMDEAAAAQESTPVEAPPEESLPEPEPGPAPEPEPAIAPPPVIREYLRENPPEFEPIAACCFSLSGPEEERLHVLTGNLLTFGRSRDCDVVVRAYASDENVARELSRKISRAHFSIERRADDVLLTDGAVVDGRRKRSGNGTYADGQLVDTLQLFRTGVEMLKLTREGEAQSPPSWHIELMMSPPVSADLLPGFEALPTGPQGLLLKRMDGLCEDILLLWGCVDLKARNLTEEPLALARLKEGFGLWNGEALMPLEPGFRVGGFWTVGSFDQLDYAGLIT